VLSLLRKRRIKAAERIHASSFIGGVREHPYTPVHCARDRVSPDRSFAHYF
jgi:hypothetical protein